MFNHDHYQDVPEYTLNALDRWAKDGEPQPGGFITAVLENDLDGAVAHADSSNRVVLHRIMKYIWNELPSGCYGSPEDVKRWMGLPAGVKENG